MEIPPKHPKDRCTRKPCRLKREAKAPYAHMQQQQQCMSLTKSCCLRTMRFFSEISFRVFITRRFYSSKLNLAGLSTFVLVETGCQKFIEPVLSLLRYKINLVGIDLSTKSIDKCRFWI